MKYNRVRLLSYAAKTRADKYYLSLKIAYLLIDGNTRFGAGAMFAWNRVFKKLSISCPFFKLNIFLKGPSWVILSTLLNFVF
jgi:hypothetical protein